MSRSVVFRILSAALLLTVACNSSTDPIQLSVPAVTLEAVGDSRQLEANGTGGALPTWESLSPDIITVTRAGMVTALSAGSGSVRAQLDGRTAQGTVIVLPAVSVEVSAASAAPGDEGWDDVTLQLVNTGGRGFYRLTFYRESAEPGGEAVIISQDLTDFEAAVGLNISHKRPVPAPAHWAVVYSREPQSLGYLRTACLRVNGEPGCPLP